MGNPVTVRKLWKWSMHISPDLVFISETMISKEAVEMKKGRIGFSNAFRVASQGKSGGLCLFWNEEVTDFSLVSFSQNHICGDVNKGEVTWRFVGIYRWLDSGNKFRTWALIEHFCRDVDVPIIFGGDFNELLSHEEKDGGSDRERSEIAKFREMVDTCELRGLGFEGQWWTWERGNSIESYVRERLDRYLASPSWMDLFPNAYVEHLLRHSSDHTPIVVRTRPRDKQQKRPRKSFKFKTAWLLDTSCEAVIKEA
ncbi:uncharacterized protein LOC110686251 [Chenopodium quinoa]|uniref:uncharacterized protein LOC110686251 n=1 Tax=Chenopodium quinoa TaxID=63459 RepID=UPI000B76E382|nr:uncharacterized protein LOC110686251 [Chenopodium quinoa]